MSAISGFINTIRNAVYGEQVRGAIISALEACYSDVNAPSLQTAAFTAALNTAYAGGILDIQTVTQISSMTNQQIIYRYNGTQAGYQKGLYYYSALSSSWVLIGSEIHSVSLSSQMTDTNAIYKYTGTQTGMVQNSLYCYNGTAWVPIGSGVLTASTAAQMTNEGAIYKYTGSEAGYVTNALYYHNGTAWVPVSAPTDYTMEAGGTPADARAIGNIFLNSLNVPLEFGTLATATGTASNSDIRRRTTYLPQFCSFVGCTAKQYKCYIFVYNSSNTYLGIWNGSEIEKASYSFTAPFAVNLFDILNIDPSYKIRVVIGKVGDATMSSADDEYIVFKKNYPDPRVDAVVNLLYNAVYTTPEIDAIKPTLVNSGYPIRALKFEGDSTVTLSKNTHYFSAVDALGLTVTPSGFSESFVVTSSNSEAVTVNSDGSITTGASGAATITIKGRYASFVAAVTVGEAASPLQDPSRYKLNYSVYNSSAYYGQKFDDIQAPVNARALFDSLYYVGTGTARTITFNSAYKCVLSQFDNDGNFRAQVNTGNQVSSGYSFTPTYPYISISLVTPSTATAEDIISAGITIS